MVFSPARAFSVNQSRPYLPASLATCVRSSWRSSDSVNGVSVDVLMRWLLRGIPRGFHDGEDLAGGDLLAGGDVDLGDGARGRGGDGVLHLHGLEDEDDVARSDVLAVGDGDLDDRAGHRREQAAARHRVGRVGEARDLAQRDVAHRASRRRRRVAGDRPTSIRRGPHGDAVDLEPRPCVGDAVEHGRARRRRSRRGRPTTRPGRRRRRTSVTCGWRDDVAPRRPGCRAGPYAAPRRRRPAQRSPPGQRPHGPARRGAVDRLLQQGRGHVAGHEPSVAQDRDELVAVGRERRGSGHGAGRATSSAGGLLAGRRPAR